jgi:hypothetical protein
MQNVTENPGCNTWQAIGLTQLELLEIVVGKSNIHSHEMSDLGTIVHNPDLC